AAFHAPAAGSSEFIPALVLDAALTGAKGLNLWSSFRTPAPQRSTRLYRRLVDGRLASSVAGALIPTEHPFIYTISATVNTGVTLADCEAALIDELDRVARAGITPAELVKAKAQLRARLVFDNDSVTNVAHQIGYFETIGATDVYHALTDRVAAVDLASVNALAAQMLQAANRTVGWFDPVEE